MWEEQKQTEELKVIVFHLQQEEYGVDIAQVLSIERMQPVTRVPRTPHFVKGVINLRGVVTPVVDLRGRLGLEEGTYTNDTRIIIVSVEGIHVGLIVDSADDVIDIPVDAIEPPPKAVGGVDAVYLRGVAKLGERLLILLNLEKVLDPEEIQQIKQIEGIR